MDAGAVNPDGLAAAAANPDAPAADFMKVAFWVHSDNVTKLNWRQIHGAGVSDDSDDNDEASAAAATAEPDLVNGFLSFLIEFQNLTVSEKEDVKLLDTGHHGNILAAINAGWVIPNYFEQNHEMEGWDTDRLNDFQSYLLNFNVRVGSPSLTPPRDQCEVEEVLKRFIEHKRQEQDELDKMDADHEADREARARALGFGPQNLGPKGIARREKRMREEADLAAVATVEVSTQTNELAAEL